ncbi:hypothetical protein ACROYT_G010642 [Oculina patagonica]
MTDAALDAFPGLASMEELDEMPTLEELSKAIDNLACGKAPGLDSIPAEVLKHGKPSILQPLHELLCQCWEKEHIPQDMRDASIVTLYKNKGDRSDCNRGISLLSIVGKVALVVRVALGRLQSLASRVYPESQCGFRAGRSTVDMIFSLRQLQEKCREQQQPLFLAFVDLTKAFDLVSRSGLFQILQKIGCPPKLLAIIGVFHKDMQSTVCFNGATSDAFRVSSGEVRPYHQSKEDKHPIAQDAETPPIITINSTELEVVDSFTYLGSTMSSKASLDVEISSRIGSRRYGQTQQESVE